MTDDGSEQRSITDYYDTGNQSSVSDQPETEEEPPPNGDPNELLTWLREDTHPELEEVVGELPELIRQVQSGGYGAWSAGKCIDIILKSTTSPIDCPELVAVLDDDHVDPLAVIEHLLEIYPCDAATLETSFDSDCLERDELSHTDRMEGYRALSRLPPDNSIYTELKRTAEMFDGVVDLDERYPVGGFFQTYAMRCLKTYLRYPQEAPGECVHRAIVDHPWQALRVIAANTEQAADTDLLEQLIEVIDERPIPEGFYHGRVIARLCDEYTGVSSQDTQQEIGHLIETVLEAGVYPTQWKETVPQLIGFLEQGDGGEQGGAVLASVFGAVQVESAGDDLNNWIDEIMRRLGDNDPSPWTGSVNVFAESWPEKLCEHVDVLVTVARTCDSDARTDICEALSILGEVKPGVVLPAIEPLVGDLERITSAQELVDVGKILQSLGVYPPPQQLKNLYGSTDKEIDKKAKEIVADLRRQFQGKTPQLIPGDIECVQALSEDYSLVRRTGAVSWDSPSLGSAELSVIQAVARLAAVSAEEDEDQHKAICGVLAELLDTPQEDRNELNESLQFVVPSYDSTWFEFAVLGAVFAQVVNPDTRVALHTPATGGWGTKKDVREALQKYALAPSDDHTEIIPVLDLVPTARITDEELTVETTGSTVIDDPPFLTLVRDIEPLAEAPADIILYNYLPGIDAADAAQLQQWRGTLTGGSISDGVDQDPAVSADGYGEIADRASLTNLVQVDDVDPNEFDACHRDRPMHIEMYSIFTSQHATDRRQHVGPPTDLPQPNFIDHEAEADETVATDEASREAVELTSGSSPVDLHAVQTGDGIGELLTKIDEYSQQISDSEMIRAVRGFRYTIGSLPVPVELHDTWVQTQIDQGNKWVPRQISSRRDGIQALADEAGFDAELLDEVVITIDTLLERIDGANPLSEELMDVLDDAAEGGKQVGILCAKKTYKDMLDVYLKEKASDWILGDDLRLLDEHTVRELSPGEVDWLITFDPLPPQTAIYYHHPAVEKTIVLGHADGTLESRVYGVDYKRRPYLPRCVDVELPEVDVTTYGSTPEISEDDKSLTDDLYRSYLSVAAQSRDDDGSQSGSSGENSRYRVQFEEAEETTMWDSHPMIVQSEEHLVSAGEYGLQSLSRVSSGDEMVLIESDARQDLWEEFLREDWEDSDEAADAEEAFMDAVELWYEAVSTGLAAHSETSDPGDGIWDFAREIESDVSVATDTIVGWARGVYRADSPSDLVFRSELRIGPRHADGVEAVAEAYGSDRMADNWNQVLTRMKAIRATHRQRGSVFWQWLADRACDGDLFDQPGVSQVIVARCEEIE